MKKNFITSSGALLLLIIMFAGATYAYFKSVDASNTNFDTFVTTNTVDSLIFKIDSDISITANKDNFKDGMGNQSGSAHASAILKANNKTHSAAGEYYLYLDITENKFLYTIDEDSPELLLQVSGPEGALGDGDIEGLSYVTVEDGQGNEISGFDITTKKDLITIASKKKITTTSEKTDNWDITVIFVNLDANQNANGGKKFTGKLYITKDEMEPYNLPKVNSIEVRDIAETSVDVKISAIKGSNDIIKYLFSVDDWETTEESTENTFTIGDLLSGSSYILRVKAVDSNDQESNELTKEIATTYVNPTVDSISFSDIDIDTITVYIEATEGSHEITDYYYSSDNGETWVNSTADSYTFDVLTPDTTYDFKVYVTDINGKTSNVVSDSESTLEPPQPVITSVEPMYIGSEEVELVILVDEMIDIDTFYYSMDGDDWNESSDGNVLITDLKFSTDYTFYFKVLSIYGVESEIYELTIQTALCFAPGTKVLTKNGLKNIEDIKVGEYVYTINMDTNEKELQQVTNTIISDAYEIFEITVGGKTIKSTPRHEFYVLDKGWVRAFDLEKGDILSSTINGPQEIENIKYKKLDEPMNVYNLTIDGNHNYLITENEILVHNNNSYLSGDNNDNGTQ